MLNNGVLADDVGHTDTPSRNAIRFYLYRYGLDYCFSQIGCQVNGGSIEAGGDSGKKVRWGIV